MHSQFGGMPYVKQVQIWQQLDQSINYGSPMNVWTSKMFAVLKEANGDKSLATEILYKRRLEVKR